MYENSELDQTQGRWQNFQEVGGQAKPYQVRQLLNAIDYVIEIRKNEKDSGK